MPSLMLVPIAVSEELKQTHRQRDKIALYILDACVFRKESFMGAACKRYARQHFQKMEEKA